MKTLTLTTLALLLCCVGCASLGTIGQQAEGDALPFATGAVMALLSGKDMFPHRTDPPTAPGRKPDIRTAAGGEVWLDSRHRPTNIRTAAGAVFDFGYDGHGTINEVVEPNGCRLTRNSPSDWTRHSETPDGKKTEFYGKVVIGARHEIRYISGDGSQVIHNLNGSTVEVENYHGCKRLTKVTDRDGQTSEFGYDPEGKPMFIKTSGGFLLTCSGSGQWHRMYPGTTFDTVVPYKVLCSSPWGTVTIITPTTITTYGWRGVSTVKHKKSHERIRH